ncbi:hypothetical protein fugu_010168 [Takifugu bimaculatus]|uniref:Uncharacterized protein n=1 Tax=Takifugu bimaculatus TaxID=433685 RepID=A0A4Z2CEU9_9TELE|nr:hypothetical protein fugu_010168 [Takifugu bimaculatus]
MAANATASKPLHQIGPTVFLGRPRFTKTQNGKKPDKHLLPLTKNQSPAKTEQANRNIAQASQFQTAMTDSAALQQQYYPWYQQAQQHYPGYTYPYNYYYPMATVSTVQIQCIRRLQHKTH